METLNKWGTKQWVLLGLFIVVVTAAMSYLFMGMAGGQP
jgi:hypothetical protein